MHLQDKAPFAKEEANVPRSELIYRQIKENILTNVYRAGFQALEPQLADMLEVSRTPVREALIRLEAEGLVKLTPRRGMQVVAYSQSDFLQLHTLIGGILLICIGDLAHCEQASEISEQLLTEDRLAQSHLDQESVSTWLHAYESSVLALVGLSGNSHYENLVRSLQTKLHRAYFSLASLLDSRDLDCFRFELLVSGIQKKNESEVAQQLESMFAQQASMFDEIINKYQILPL